MAGFLSNSPVRFPPLLCGLQTQAIWKDREQVFAGGWLCARDWDELVSGADQSQFLPEMIHRSFEANVQRNLRLPVKLLAREADIRPASHRIVGTRWMEHQLRRTACVFDR